jgi:hypothetical protein
MVRGDSQPEPSQIADHALSGVDVWAPAVLATAARTRGDVPQTAPSPGRDEDVKDQIAADTGVRPPFALEAFTDVDGDVRQPIARIQASPFLQHKNVRGFVYEVEKDSLRQVT